jgi:hypothetical protein
MKNTSITYSFTYGMYIALDKNVERLVLGYIMIRNL